MIRSVGLCVSLGLLAGALLAESAGDGATIPSGTILRAYSTDGRSKLATGSQLRAETAEPLFSEGREVLPRGTRLEAVVRRVRRPPGTRSFWRRLARTVYQPFAASPGRPPFTFATESAVCRFGNAILPAELTVVGLLEPAASHSASKDGAVRVHLPEKRRLLLFELGRELKIPIPVETQPAPTGDMPELPAGTRARLILLSPLSASRNREGDEVRARLIEPVVAGGNVVLPGGSFFSGRVAMRVRPRRLNRSALLRLRFDRVTLPTGQSQELSASVSQAETDRRDPASLNSEGALTSHLGKRALITRLAGTYLTGKLADDLTEEGVKWALGAAASGTAVTAAKYVGIGSGLFFLAIQKGRDVRLPAYTELEVTLNRPLVFKAPL